MSEEAKRKAVEPESAKPDEENKIEAAQSENPFDLSKLRLDQNFIETAGVKRLLTTVPVRKPGPQDFVRVNSHVNYRANVALLELRDDREIYLLTPAMAQELPGEFYMATLYVAINRQGVVPVAGSPAGAGWSAA